MEPNINESFPVPNLNQIQGAKLEGPVELLKSSWALFKSNWKSLVPIVIAPTVLFYISQIFILSLNPGLTLVAFILIILGFIMSIAMQPASVDAIHRISTEPGLVVSFLGQYKFGFKFFWSIVLLLIMQVLIITGSVILLFIPGVIVAVYVTMYLFVRVLDDKKGFAAYEESFSLVKGRWFATLGRILFIALIYLLAAIVMVGVAFIIQSLLNLPKGSDGESVLAIILNLVSYSILGPLMLIYTYKLYLSLKITRQVGVVTSAFKNWLIAFMVVGVIAVLTIPILGGILFAVSEKFGTGGRFMDSNGYRIQEIDNAVVSSSTNPSTK